MNKQNLQHIKQRFCAQTGVHFAPAAGHRTMRRTALLLSLIHI